MNQEPPSFFLLGKAKGLWLADPEDHAVFAAGLRKYLASAIKAPPSDDVEKNVDCIHKTSYARSLQRLTTKRDEELRLAHESCEEADRLDEKVMDGKIPEFCREQSWMLPQGFWAKAAFAVLAGSAVVAPLVEMVNLSWYLRYQTQSLPVAFLYCSPILILPVAEAVILCRFVRKNKIKKNILLGQASVALVSGIIYFALTLRHGDTSLATMFSGQVPSLSTDPVRMAAQIVASVLLGAICLHSAIEMGRRETPENDAFRAAQEKVKDLRKIAGAHFDTVSDINGELEKIQVQKPKAVLFCQRQFARIEAEYDRHTSTLNELINESISI